MTTGVERGRIAATNWAASAVYSAPVPGAWEPGPAALADIRLVSHPARCTRPGDLEASRFDLDLGARRPVSIIALMRHSLMGGVSARVRITGAADPGYSEGVTSTGWVSSLSRAHASAGLKWEGGNFWGGEPSPQELEAYGRDIIIPLSAPWSCRYLKCEIDDVANSRGFFDLGYLFVGDLLLPPYQFSRGASQGLVYRTVVDEAPSGHQIFDARKSARTHTIPFNATAKDGWAQLYDIAVLNGPQHPVLWLPTLNDPRHQFREAFLGRMTAPPAGRLIGPDGWRSTEITITEIIA